MRNTLILTGKELRSYFVSPVAYVVMAAFLLINGYFFSASVVLSHDSSLRYIFSDMSIVLLLLAPIMTMRLLSEEKKSGTIELLLTSPMRDGEVVVGKFLASFLFLGVMLVLTSYWSLIIQVFGNPDWGPVITGYIGVALLGGCFLSLGLFTSSLTQNQIVAAVLSFAVLMVLWLITWISDIAGPQYKDIIAYLGLIDHFDDFTKGVINLKDVVFYLSVIAISLLGTVRVLESRRWK